MSIMKLAHSGFKTDKRQGRLEVLGSKEEWDYWEVLLTLHDRAEGLRKTLLVPLHQLESDDMEQASYKYTHWPLILLWKYDSASFILHIFKTVFFSQTVLYAYIYWHAAVCRGCRVKHDRVTERTDWCIYTKEYEEGCLLQHWIKQWTENNLNICASYQSDISKFIL